MVPPPPAHQPIFGNMMGPPPPPPLPMLNHPILPTLASLRFGHQPFHQGGGLSGQYGHGAGHSGGGHARGGGHSGQQRMQGGNPGPRRVRRNPPAGKLTPRYTRIFFLCVNNTDPRLERIDEAEEQELDALFIERAVDEHWVAAPAGYTLNEQCWVFEGV